MTKISKKRKIALSKIDKSKFIHLKEASSIVKELTN
jgi:hypothetical protein